MTPSVAAELARILRHADPPPADVRRCAWSGCDEPLVRREGEQPGDFARRQTCCDDHRYKRGGEQHRANTHRFAARGRG